MKFCKTGTASLQEGVYRGTTGRDDKAECPHRISLPAGVSWVAYEQLFLGEVPVIL
jgi:hypothetical protein